MLLPLLFFQNTENMFIGPNTLYYILGVVLQLI